MQSAKSTPYFNCTIQELKQSQIINLVVTTDNFNCTIQELKPTQAGGLTDLYNDFNCTIQELKHSLVLASLPR